MRNIVLKMKQPPALRVAGVVCGLMVVTLLGCRIEKPTPHVDVFKERAEKRLDNMITPRELPPPAQDEAAQVLQTCGRPASDKILPIYTKLEHGPVRRLVYTGRRRVTLDFVPSDPQPHSRSSRAAVHASAARA